MRRLVAIIFGALVAACANTAESAPSAAVPVLGAQIRAATFITADLDASIAFYTDYLGFRELRRSDVEAAKSRRVIGLEGTDPALYVSLAPADWTPDSGLAGISFIGIEPTAEAPVPDPARAARGGEVILSSRTVGLEALSRRFAADGVPVIAPYGPSGSGRSMSMAVLDPNGIRVELYEY